MDFRSHGPFTVLSPLLARVLARDSHNDEATLKALLESMDASPPVLRTTAP